MIKKNQTCLLRTRKQVSEWGRKDIKGGKESGDYATDCIYSTKLCLRNSSDFGKVYPSLHCLPPLTNSDTQLDIRLTLYENLRLGHLSQLQCYIYICNFYTFYLVPVSFTT